MISLCCISVYPSVSVLPLYLPLILEVFEAYEITFLSVCVSLLKFFGILCGPCLIKGK
jgi:hypothetical protein